MSPFRANGRSSRSCAPSPSSDSSWASSSCSSALPSSSLEQRLAQPVEHRRADDLLLEVRRLQHRHGREARLHELELLALDRPPGAEVAALDLLREDAVHDHRVGQVAVQRQVGERPHRLGDDHLVGRHHEPDRDRLAVAQDVVHGDQVLDQPLDLGEHPLVGQRDVEERLRQRPRRGQQRPLAPEHLVEPPARDVGEREQPQRLAGRRAVDDHDVPVALVDVALDLQQREQLVAAGRHGQLLGRDPVDALVDEQPAEPPLHRRPVALQLVLGLHLLGPQAAADVGRLGADARLQRLRQRVRGVGREHDRPLPRGGAAACRGSGDRRLADAALARVEDGPRPQRARFLGFKTSIVPSAVPTFPARSVAVSATSYSPALRGTCQLSAGFPCPTTTAGLV